MFTNHSLKSFEQLQEEFQLPATERFFYLQISHLNSINSQEILLHKQGWQYLQCTSSSIKGTSLFYNLLQNKLVFSKSAPYSKWESDLGETFTTQQWQLAFKTIYQTSKCANHWELTQKIALRWYLTPYRMSKFLPSQSPLCWRGCGTIGQLKHIFWSCKPITSFWNKIFCTISEITGIITQALAILNIGIERFPHDCRGIVTHIFLAAKTFITRKWKSNLAPNISDVIEIVKCNYAFESILAYRHGNKRLFDHYWNLWVNKH